VRCARGLYLAALGLASSAHGFVGETKEDGANAPSIGSFFEATSPDEKVAKAALDRIATGWRDSYAALIIDIARFLPRSRTPDEASEEVGLDPEGSRAAGPPRGGGFREPTTAVSTPQSRARERLIHFLEKQTRQRFGQDLRRWRRWIWGLPKAPHPDYATFKARLYAVVDPKMAAFFPPGVTALIRLDEVDWGGVTVNGIPPLDHPKHVPATEAGYLDDKNLVFGILLKGEARAYPKRILAWHEMARDRVGGIELALVYCTLCGTVIPYGSEPAGRAFTFGTSGLLYRSNKLMFDAETRSLWSTTEGKPVIGPLAGSELELPAYPVVTTTWREWRTAHPETTVLSLDTGHRRDYSEGAAYRDYFATDQIMFEVPARDERLKNKAEVLGLLLPPADAPNDAPRKALAASTDFLRKNPVHHLTFAGHDLVIVTTPAGANRVYFARGTRFARWRSETRLDDNAGRSWHLTEDALVLEGNPGTTRPRVPARRAFWFGWHAQFPDGELVM